MDGVRFHEGLMNFNDLGIINSVNNEPYCYYGYYGYYYKNDLNLTNKGKRSHLLEEYEVYKLVKKNQ